MLPKGLMYNFVYSFRVLSVPSLSVMLQGPTSLAVVIESINHNLRMWMRLSDCHVSYIIQFWLLSVTQRPRVALHDWEWSQNWTSSLHCLCLYIHTISPGWWFSMSLSPVSLTIYGHGVREINVNQYWRLLIVFSYVRWRGVHFPVGALPEKHGHSGSVTRSL